MKKIFYFLLVFPLFLSGQSTSQNFIKTTLYKQANSTSVTNPAPSVAAVQVTYFDGLGRPIQQIANKQSATGKDIIVPIVYDNYGLQTKEYLPYPSTGLSMAYDAAAVTNVTNYSQYTGQTAYSEKQYEASPLNRVLKQAAPGNDWDMPISATDPDHTQRIDYLNNTLADNVKLYKATATWNLTKGLYDIALTNVGGTIFYPANQLYKTVIKNENWTIANGNNNTIQEFKDKNNHTILKRMFDNGVAHDTYYVYDQFGNLTYVIPPLVNTSATISQNILDGLCYQYKYDYRNRLVEKKLPGKQWEFIVYDKLDRVVATGPSFSPFSDLTTSGWLISKYDIYNRIVYTGWQSSSTITTADRKTLQDAQNSLTTTLNESKLTSGTIDGIATYYSNLVTPTSFKLLSVNYYDSYTFPNVATIPTTVEIQSILTTSQVKTLPTGSWNRILTASTSLTGETASVFYDPKGRVVETYLKNYLGGYTKTDVKLDFVGVQQYTITYHKRLATDTEIKVTDNFTFTPQGRLLTDTHQIGSGIVQLLSKNEYNELGQLITKRVGGTDITGATSLQKVDYSYNIRGWLTNINDINDLLSENDLFAFKINYNTVENETDYTGTPLYNGNMSETYWKTSSDNVLRKYGYQYDNLNRLTNAIYQKPGTTTPVTNSYNESMSYDKNGNIISLQREGNLDTDVFQIAMDNLNYTYASSSNQLVKVLDTTNNPSGFKDDSADGITDPVNDYTYDANGNMLTDQNKAISSIKYNHLNLPTEIVFSGTNKKINYLYNSIGIKLQKTITNGSTITKTDYLNGFQYLQNGTAATVLQFFPTAEGYVNNTVITGSNVYNYIFNYTDNLGNIRVSYTLNTAQTNSLIKIIQENNYYPFGLQHSNYNGDQYEWIGPINSDTGYYSPILTFTNGKTGTSNKYKYQGQERQDELGLNWDSFKWRNYDYAIGRFMSVDPLSEKYNWQSNYVFGSNQVVHSRELEGLEAENDFNDYGGNDYDWNLSGNNASFGCDVTNHESDNQLDVKIYGHKGDFDREDESYGYDNGRYGQQEGVDNDGDGYSREDRANNERALEEMASNYQNIGTVISLVGIGLSLTAVGAPVGAVLMALGSGLSWSGIGIEFAEDAFDGHDGMDWGNHAMNIGSELIPGYYDDYFGSGSDDIIKGADNLMIELGAAGSDFWMDTMSDLHKK